MLTDVGEYIVGAYLQLILGCDVVDYNVRPPGGGLEGLEEMDVIGLNLKTHHAYLCEVTTHIRGVLYKDNRTTVERITKKHERQKRYGVKFLENFECEYMFWSPVVPVGYITEHLSKLEELQLIINGEYKRRVEELRKLAAKTTHDARNPVFRLLQVMEHMRD
ncbi:hypothetical protein [Uliginosibacterium sp. 31-12]|uniref:hypothetical protein n=1 Tax=Uliginosibacterium sp. 31-12 TaxID=3062781 RepID=UPI0026E20504|nr:hypothetical protein [Uliginosibacterium sp. 31-12]MDO6387909.1 hypothetical protein [Uliginosibacterium sp. 31-12]